MPVLAAITGAPLLMIAIPSLCFTRFLPETKVAWRDVWLGAIISAALILAAVILVGLFFQVSSLSSALQAAGAFTVLLVGFYYIAQIFLLGAVCCRVYANLLARGAWKKNQNKLQIKVNREKFYKFA